MPLVAHLESLLPAAPARVLCLSCPEIHERLKSSGHELCRRLETREIDEQRAFDAVVWGIEDSPEAPEQAVSRLRRLLGESGEIITVGATRPGAPAPSKRQGSLPSERQTRLRAVIRHLCEAGFTIRRDLDVPRSPGDPPGPAGWKILVARPDPFLIRGYQEGDEQAILRLFHTCFPHGERGLDHWRWKFGANPYGSCKISLAFSPAGEMAAHYGGYPSPVWRQGRSFIALVIGDTMADDTSRQPAHGRGGLLARTVRHFFSIHRNGTLGFYYGFNTGPIQRFCRWFIGGSETYPVDYWTRELEPSPGWRAGGYRIRRVEAFGAAWDRFFHRVAPSYGFLTRRDASYLDWRYRRRPDTRYVILAAYRWRRLVGWSVFRRRGDSIVWGDALFDPRHSGAARPLLAAALAEPELTGAKSIEAWFPASPSWWRQQVEALGLLTQPEPQGLGMVALADSEPEAFAKLEEMYYTMGDGDLF